MKLAIEILKNNLCYKINELKEYKSLLKEKDNSIEMNQYYKDSIDSIKKKIESIKKAIKYLKNEKNN